MINGAKYSFYQVHWHTPSENTVDGRSFALEAHFVHQLADEGLHGTYHRLAVIGLLYELSEECNVFLDYFWDSFPEDKGVSAYEGQELDFNAKLAEELAEGYWHWYGSLTTPPCTEGVLWMLQSEIMELPPDAIAEIKSHVGEYPVNARPTQPLNGRVVETFVAPATE